MRKFLILFFLSFSSIAFSSKIEELDNRPDKDEIEFENSVIIAFNKRVKEEEKAFNLAVKEMKKIYKSASKPPHNDPFAFHRAKYYLLKFYMIHDYNLDMQLIRAHYQAVEEL